MAKRENRLRPIDHERRQIEALKTLTPNATPPTVQALSDTLIDIACAALDEVYRLEASHAPQLMRLQQLVALVDSLPEKVSTSQAEDQA